MKRISLSSSVDELYTFFKEKGVFISETMWEALCVFLTKICFYEEEERRIFPHLVIGHNIESEEFEKVFHIQMIPLVDEKKEELFIKRLKPILPFCNNGWRVYVDINETEMKLGVMRNFSGIAGVSIDEILLGTKKEDAEIIRADFSISFVMIRPVGRNEFEIVAMDGEVVKVDFCLYNNDKNPCEEDKISFVQDFLSLDSNEKVFKAVKKVVDLFPQKLHGTICLIVNEGCNLPNEQLHDGIFLRKPIEIKRIAKEILDNSNSFMADIAVEQNEKFYAITGLFLEMLNFDGITIIDTDGKILAYNVFIASDSGTAVSVGGARKRAAMALLESRNASYVGVYFQSQDGDFFYERIQNI